MSEIKKFTRRKNIKYTSNYMKTVVKIRRHVLLYYKHLYLQGDSADYAKTQCEKKIVLKFDLCQILF